MSPHHSIHHMSWLSSIFHKSAALPPSKDSVSAKVRQLEKLDIHYEVFGSSSHHYKLTPVSDRDLKTFEEWCGVSMPAEYRAHLHATGFGAGPYYGLLSPAKICEEIKTLRLDNPAYVQILGDFPLTMEHAQSCADKIAKGEKTPWVQMDWPCEGCIPICHQGCSYWTALQITGENRGCVWDIDMDGCWLPARAPTSFLKKSKQSSVTRPVLSTLPTFEEWFHSWLEHALITA